MQVRRSHQLLGIALGTGLGLAPLSVARAVEPAVEAPELDAIVQRFASMPGLEARFHEEKQLALLRAPLESEGMIYFAPPDRLLRRVERPIESTLFVRGARLEIGDATGTRTLDLASLPALGAFVDGLRSVLAGDLGRLRETYGIELVGGTGPPPRAWQLRLIPRTAPLRDAISSIEIFGHEDALTELRVREASGDESITRFSDVDSARRFGELELERLFRAQRP